MASSASSQGRSGFEFRMSKKVAELTQVVHMLFTRNHEKEVELEAVKDAYEYEIELVLKDAHQRIASLERKIQSLQSVSSAAAAAATARQEAEAREAALGAELGAERREHGATRDLLVAARRDTEREREARAQAEAQCRHQLALADTRHHELHAEVQRLREEAVRGGEVTGETLAQLRAANSRLQATGATASKQLEEAERARDLLHARNKQLEADIKHLKRELTKRLASMSAKEKQQHMPQPPPVPPDYAAELEVLRAQVQKYRNELTNRETNFNRMFTEKQPVNLTSKRGVRLSLTQSPMGDTINNMRFSRDNMTRQKTFYATSSAKTSEVSDTPDTPRSASSIERLPQLEQNPAGSAARLQKLAKPRPLPRELLSAKAKT